MNMVNPLGTYSVFNTDGSPMQWAEQPVRIEVTANNKVHLYAGTWEKPVAVSDLPLYPFATRSIFDGYLRMLVERAKFLHLTMVAEKIQMTIAGLNSAMAEKDILHQQYMGKQINADEWKEKLLTLLEEMTITRELFYALRDEIRRNGGTCEILTDGFPL